MGEPIAVSELLEVITGPAGNTIGERYLHFTINEDLEIGNGHAGNLKEGILSPVSWKPIILPMKP